MLVVAVAANSRLERALERIKHAGLEKKSRDENKSCD